MSAYRNLARFEWIVGDTYETLNVGIDEDLCTCGA
jgi:hypothetical protein